LKVVLSGHPPIDSLINDKSGYFTADANLLDLNNLKYPHLYSTASASFKGRYGKDRNELTVKEKAEIKKLVDVANNLGLKTRFWATGDNEELWSQLMDLGIYWMNVDDLKKYSGFIRK
jgi:glycerophosphoryl diester phosphodiesterase